MKKNKNGNYQGMSPKSQKNLQPPVTGTDDPKYLRMKEGLKKHQEKQRLKKQTAAQAKANLEAAFQQLSLEDVDAAIREGIISEESVNPILLVTKAINSLGDPTLLDKDGRAFWMELIKQQRAMLGTEAAKKAEQTVDLKDNASLTREELQEKAKKFKNKFTNNIVEINKNAK